ncbi:MAG: phosphocholine cytidylyltransferase family protein [Phyllobacteriaceae bacterium]|nr:phosphocholine cytidylyltransferase family protein [Phyllobacteriaceae bacterium]
MLQLICSVSLCIENYVLPDTLNLTSGRVKMKVSTAVILAAGRGTRLAGVGLNVPKGLVEIGGEALVKRSVRLLQTRGIRDVLIVTGHQSFLYDRFAAAEHGVHCIYNENFESKGSLESLRLALAAVTSPFLLLDSDILYESRGLDALLNEPSENAALISGLTGSGDEYYVWENSTRHIYHFSKLLSDQPVAPAGEHVGILKVGERLHSALHGLAPTWLVQNPLEAYESLLIELLRDHPLKNTYVPDLRWSEIDDESMLDTARRIIWPSLVSIGDL